MRGGKHLLLLAALVLVTSQQNLQVLMLPDLKQVYSGDLFYLSCNSSTRGDTVKWFFNNEEQSAPTNKTWKFAVAAAKHSGSYHCETGGSKSDTVNISVRECIPRASLTLETGQPVMRPGGSVILQIDNEDGLQESNWRCFVHKGGRTRKIMLQLKSDTVSLSFQPNSLVDPENIFWCADKALEQRSNQIVVWTSDKQVSMEMYPVPVMAGESVTLRCLTWGTDQISHAVIYVNNSANQPNYKGPTFEIPSVTESEKGTYKCSATFTYPARTEGPPYQMDSDPQNLYIYEIPMRAELSEDMSCSCSRCPGNAWYRWYCRDDGGALTFKDSNQGSMSPWDSGTYSCRAVWKEGRSLLSKSRYQQPTTSKLVVFVVIALVVLGATCIAVGVCIQRRRRQATGQIYEDVGLNKLDNQYEPLQRPEGGRREGEYDTLHAGTTGKKEGEHQPSQEGAGGYEALRKEGRKEEVYHALGKEGAEGGAGGYEALRKEGGKDEVYHTLGEEGVGSGGGGYEALKKQEKAVEVYHTLELVDAASAKGGHEENDEYEMVQEKK